MKDELWRPIKGYEKEYLVSRDGHVFSIRSNKQLLPCKNEKGYLRVCLQLNGKKEWKRVHRLVAEAFIPNPEGKETVNHKNGVRDDNAVENLEWASMLEQNGNDARHKKNISDGIRNSQYLEKKRRPVIQRDMKGEIVATYPGMQDAARAVNSSVGNIYLCCHGQRKTCKGYSFSYADV